MARPLTPKQDLFCREYIADPKLNATQAAVRAGYSAKNADKIGSQLLGKARVAARISELMAERKERLGVTADAVVRELARLAFADIGQVVDFAGGTLRLRDPAAIPEDARRAIQSVKVRRYAEGGRDGDAREVELTEFKLADKKGPLELLGKHLGLFADRLQIGGDPASPPVKNEHTLSGAIDHLAAAFAAAADRQGAGGLPTDRPG